ncbi:hypothetical protein IAT38_000723 [Cryptococcus sp. DSM 104549]
MASHLQGGPDLLAASPSRQPADNFCTQSTLPLASRKLFRSRFLDTSDYTPPTGIHQRPSLAASLRGLEWDAPCKEAPFGRDGKLAILQEVEQIVHEFTRGDSQPERRIEKIPNEEEGDGGEEGADELADDAEKEEKKGKDGKGKGKDKETTPEKVTVQTWSATDLLRSLATTFESLASTEINPFPYIRSINLEGAASGTSPALITAQRDFALALARSTTPSLFRWEIGLAIEDLQPGAHPFAPLVFRDGHLPPAGKKTGVVHALYHTNPDRIIPIACYGTRNTVYTAIGHRAPPEDYVSLIAKVLRAVHPEMDMAVGKELGEEERKKRDETTWLFMFEIPSTEDLRFYRRRWVFEEDEDKGDADLQKWALPWVDKVKDMLLKEEGVKEMIEADRVSIKVY